MAKNECNNIIKYILIALYEEYKFNGNWWDNGIGISAQIKQQHNIYLEADYALGDKFDKKQIYVGYRYTF